MAKGNFFFGLKCKEKRRVRESDGLLCCLSQFKIRVHLICTSIKVVRTDLEVNFCDTSRRGINSQVFHSTFGIAHSSSRILVVNF